MGKRSAFKKGSLVPVPSSLAGQLKDFLETWGLSYEAFATMVPRPEGSIVLSGSTIARHAGGVDKQIGLNVLTGMQYVMANYKGDVTQYNAQLAEADQEKKRDASVNGILDNLEMLNPEDLAMVSALVARLAVKETWEEKYNALRQKLASL